MIDLYDEEGDQITLPTRKEVCPRCKGNGTHMNPSIDGHGISGDDPCWDDDDFRSMYFGGGYDVPCEECGGKNVIEVLDEERAGPELVALYEQAVMEEAEMRQVQQAELRAEGWWDR